MIPRQRGIFSEILTTEDSKNLEVRIESNIKAISNMGPKADQII